MRERDRLAGKKAGVVLSGGNIDRGVYLDPYPYEAGFLSDAHTEEDVDRTVASAREALS